MRYCTVAIYHFHVDIVSRKTGRSSVAASAYRAGEKLHNEYDGITHDYSNRSSVGKSAYNSGEKVGKHDFTNKRGVVYSEIILPQNAPRKFQDRSTLWNAVEKSEKRCDAQTARDIDVALPIEFERYEQVEIMQEYIKENFVKHGMIADFAIHDKNDGNPHVHILLTTRNVDKYGFGKKNREWNNKKFLQSWRENWANICNDKLKEKGYSERIDHRTLKAQGIDREPTIHIGVTAEQMKRRGIDSDRVKENREIIAQNESKQLKNIAEYMHELKEGYIILDKEITTLQKETAEARREMQSLRITAERINERAETIQNLHSQVDKLKLERQNMGVFKDKRGIDTQIKQFEQSCEQAKNMFYREYKITYEQAETDIKRLDDRSRSFNNLQKKIGAKLTSLAYEKEVFRQEYQRLKLLAEISPDGQKISNRLSELEKESRLQNHSTQERIFRTQSERLLDIITERNFQEILQDMRPEQVENLIRQRQREIEQDRLITFQRGR